jgi:hypothetical protein
MEQNNGRTTAHHIVRNLRVTTLDANHPDSL